MVSSLNFLFRPSPAVPGPTAPPEGAEPPGSGAGAAGSRGCRCMEAEEQQSLGSPAGTRSSLPDPAGEQPQPGPRLGKKGGSLGGSGPTLKPRQSRSRPSPALAPPAPRKAGSPRSARPGPRQPVGARPSSRPVLCPRAGRGRRRPQRSPYIRGSLRAAGREMCRVGNSFAGLPPTRRLLCTSESAGAWEVFSFSFLAGAFTATALAVINFATNRNDRCIDMRPESSGCLNNRSTGRSRRLLFIRYHMRY